MKRLFSVLLAVTLCLGCLSFANADSTPLIYHVTDAEGHEVWLLGTIHMGDADVMYPISGMDQILEKCDTLALEISEDDYFDSIEANTKENMALYFSQQLSFLPMIENSGMMTNGVSEEVLRRIAEPFEVEGLERLLAYMEPLSLVSMATLANGLNAGMSTTDGVDVILHSLFRTCGKQIIGLETGESQDEILMNQSNELWVSQLNTMADVWDSCTDCYRQLVEAWSVGNREELNRIMNDMQGVEGGSVGGDLQAENESFAVAMTDLRDAAFTEKIVELLKNGGKVLVAIGSAHIYGDGAVADQLKAAGYTVEPVVYDVE